MKVFNVLLIFLLLFGKVNFAQHVSTKNYDSLVETSNRKTKFLKEVKVPIYLVMASLLVQPDNGIICNESIYEARQNHIPRFKTHIDDNIQYTPIAAVYSLNILGVKGKHNVIDQTLLLLKSELMMLAFVVPSKLISKKHRPDNSTNNSFPSGHTAQAFVAATFLHKEYGHISNWYSVSGYLAASAVGLIRIANNRHWLSDVLAGAGIGIISTEFIYLTHKPLGKRKKRKNNLLVLPTYRENNLGLLLSFKI